MHLSRDLLLHCSCVEGNLQRKPDRVVRTSSRVHVSKQFYCLTLLPVLCVFIETSNLFFPILMQMRLKCPTWRAVVSSPGWRRGRRSQGRRRWTKEGRREKREEVAPPPPLQRITSSSSLIASTPAGHWGSPCTGMCHVSTWVTELVTMCCRGNMWVKWLQHGGWILSPVYVVAVPLIPNSLSCCSSALSQPGDISAKTPTDLDTPTSDLTDHPGSTAEDGGVAEANEASGTELSGTSSANDMLCTSQTLDDEPLTPEVVAPPKAIVTPRSVLMTRYKKGHYLQSLSNFWVEFSSIDKQGPYTTQSLSIANIRVYNGLT